MPSGSTKTEADVAELLGDVSIRDAYIKAGVTRFVVWNELDTRGKMTVGYWTQAFSKLRVWSLIEYEKVLFLDADVMVLKNLDHLFQEPEFTAALSWNCGNARDTKVISGGFWLLQPSMDTFGLIQAIPPRPRSLRVEVADGGHDHDTRPVWGHGVCI